LAPLEPERERQLAKDLFNHVWTLLDKEQRTRHEDDEMIHAAHASRHHWTVVGEPVNLARGEWQCSRVYSTLRRAEPALWHGRRCLDICEEHGIGDFDLAYALEAIARAYGVAGELPEAETYARLASEAGQRIGDAEDREHFERDLASLG
jgi:hypothetical protein